MNGAARRLRRINPTRGRWRRRAAEIHPAVGRVSAPSVAFISDGAAAAAGADSLVTPLASLLTRHLLRDGELILLVIKPSVWFVLLSSLRFVAAALIAGIAGRLWIGGSLHQRFWFEATVFIIAGRLAVAAAAWVGRLYVLTDQRVLRLSGLLNVEIFDCPLRKVARTRLLRTLQERLLGLGTIEIIPQEDERPCGVWQMVARPIDVNERINAAIRRAKAG